MKPGNQPPPLNNLDKKQGIFTNLAIVAEAKRANCWLYNKMNNT